MKNSVESMSTESLGRQIQLTRRTLDQIRGELGVVTKRRVSSGNVKSRSRAREELDVIRQREREARCELQELQNEYARRIRVWLASD